MSDLLIATPLRLEAWAISAGIGIGSRRIGARPPTRVHRTGMGPRRAQTAASVLRRRPGAALLVVGFGGGLDEHSDVGDVVVADAVQGPDGMAAVACAGAPELARALERRGLRVRRGTVASVKRLATGDTRVRLREAGAIAVDMESAWLAPGAGDRPFAVVRVISDTPARELTNPLHTVTGVARATAVLRRVAGALHEWTPAAGGSGEQAPAAGGSNEWAPVAGGSGEQAPAAGPARESTPAAGTSGVDGEGLR
jgi:4-hydroxy-3-methylbut-2-enyl diphosphate reductase